MEIAVPLPPNPEAQFPVQERQWSTLAGDSRSFAQVTRLRSFPMADRGSFGGQRAPMGGSRNGRGPGNDRFGDFRDFPQRHHHPSYGQGDFRGRRHPNSQWRPRGLGRGNLHNQGRDNHFDLRENLNQNRKNMEGRDTTPEESKKQEDLHLRDTAQSDNTNNQGANQEQKTQAEKSEALKIMEDKGGNLSIGACERCGRFGHKTEECLKPVVCGRCKKEGHVPRVCEEVIPWECIAPFAGLASASQGFHVIQNEGSEYASKEITNCALIRITKGLVTARQLENEFKAQSGPNLPGGGMPRSYLTTPSK